MRFLLIFLFSFIYAQTDHLASQVFQETWDQILHIQHPPDLTNGMSIVERSDDDRTTVDTTAMWISDSLVGARPGMHLTQSGEEITASAADLNLLTNLSGKRILYDSSDVFVNAPRTIYGWSHDLTFTASDFNTIAWTSGSLYFTNLDTFSIVSGNTGNISAITWIYFYENASSTVLQTTTSGGSAVGNSRIVICVGEDVTSPKDAVFQVFGNSGQSSLIGTTQIEDNSITTGLILANTILAGDIAANTITANEIAANTIRTNEILFDDPDSIITMINGGGGTLNITADVINAVSSSGSGQRIVISPSTNRLTFYNSVAQVLEIGEDIFGALDGIDLSEQGIVYKNVSTNTAASTIHTELYSQTTLKLGGLSSLVSYESDVNTPEFSTLDFMSAYKAFGHGEPLAGDWVVGLYSIASSDGGHAGNVAGVYSTGTDYSFFGVGDLFIQGDLTGNDDLLIADRVYPGGQTTWGLDHDGASTFKFEDDLSMTGNKINNITTLNTGQGDNELYDMNQNVQTGDAVTFATVNTGQGANELYDMDQNVLSSGEVTFTVLNATSRIDITERASVPTHEASIGKLWVKNDTSAPLRYTTDDDQDLYVVTAIARTTLPGTTWEGRIVIDTDDNIAYIYADGGWRIIASGW